MVQGTSSTGALQPISLFEPPDYTRASGNRLRGSRMPKVLFATTLILGAVSCSESTGRLQDASIEAGAPGFAAYVEGIPGTDESFEMVPIAGGSFIMGSPEGEENRRADEGPQVQVRIDPFWMGVHEVTWDEYDEWNLDTELTMSKEPDGISRPTPPYTDMTFGMGRDGYPAICMTQEAAKQYCLWLSRKTGHYYRLPTEAEWEYACRAGTTTAWSFGDDVSQIDEYAWHRGNSQDKYHEVGSKTANAWGLFDMHGNVAEWTLDQLVADFYDVDLGSPRDNPFSMPTRLYPRVARGGSWYDEPQESRSAARLGSTEDWKMRDPQLPKSNWYHTDADFLGFRLVRPFREPNENQKRMYR